MRIPLLKSAALTSGILGLSLLTGCFHHRHHDEDREVVVPAGYHDRYEWHRDWDHDRYRHDRDWDRDRY